MPDAESLIRSPVISTQEQYPKRIDIDGVLRAAACRCSTPIRTSDTDRHDLMLDPFTTLHDHVTVQLRRAHQVHVVSRIAVHHRNNGKRPVSDAPTPTGRE